MQSRVRHPLDRFGSVAIWFQRSTQWDSNRSDASMLGRKVGQRSSLSFWRQTVAFGYFGLGFNEQFECLLGVCLGFGPPDRVQCLFRFRLGRLG